MHYFTDLSTVAAFAFSIIGAFAAPTDGTLSTRIPASIITECTVPNTTALTFLDGPYQYTIDIANALERAGAKGTFFFNGNNFECIYSTENQERVKYVYSHGHQVGSHGWIHANMGQLSWDEVHFNMQRVERALLRILGVVPLYISPPYGEISATLEAAAETRGVKLALWDFHIQDSIGASAAESKKLYDQIISQRPSTIFAVNHETYASTAYDVLPYAIQKLQAAGYRLVTLAECLDQQPYQFVRSPETPNDTWTC